MKKFQWNSNGHLKIFIHENALANVGYFVQTSCVDAIPWHTSQAVIPAIRSYQIYQFCMSVLVVGVDTNMKTKT